MIKLVLLGMLTILPAAALAQDATQVMERAADSYQALTSFSADFTQSIDDAMLGNYRSAGHLAQSGDVKLSMRFTEPGGDAIVVDGTNAWLYLPSSAPGQVVKLSVNQLPDFFNLSRLLTQPGRRFEARSARTERVGERTTDAVVLVPREADLPFTEVTLWVDREDGLPRRLQLKERSGAVRTFTFTNIRTNERLPNRTFTFEVPPGVHVIDNM
ncbi:MAG: outer membrane lipoprotein carrier protein LolA [Gemmatimonadota bacterium]